MAVKLYRKSTLALPGGGKIVFILYTMYTTTCTTSTAALRGQTCPCCGSPASWPGRGRRRGRRCDQCSGRGGRGGTSPRRPTSPWQSPRTRASRGGTSAWRGRCARRQKCRGPPYSTQNRNISKPKKKECMGVQKILRSDCNIRVDFVLHEKGLFHLRN